MRLSVCNLHRSEDTGIGEAKPPQAANLAPPPANSGEKYFSGKHRAIFGQLISFWKEEQAVFCFSFHV